MKKGIMIILISVMLTGCVTKIEENQKLSDLEYTVVPKQDIPESLAKKIQEKEKEGFSITFADDGYLYIARGYGTQPTSGYSISVSELYEAEETICFETNLIGPQQGEETKEVESEPYIVVKLEYIDKEVMFE